MTREEEIEWEKQHKESMKDIYKTLREDVGGGVPDPLYWVEGIYVYPDGTTEE